MFAILNPPKKGKKKARRGKRKLSPYNRFVKSFLKKHKGAGIAAAAKAYKGGKSVSKSMRRHYGVKHASKRGKAAHRGTSVARRVIAGTVCDMKKLAAARARYCGIRSRTGMVAGTASASPIRSVDYLPSAAERGYRSVANPRRRKGHKGGSKKHGLLHGFMSKLNPGKMISMAAPEQDGVFSGFQPKNLTGIVPIVGGFIANTMAQKLIADRGPSFVKGGIGSYGAGLASAGLIGALAGRLDKNVGQSMFIGGVVQTLQRIVSDVSEKGFSALSLSGGMGDFPTPEQLQAASPGALPSVYTSLAIGPAQAQAPAIMTMPGVPTVAPMAQAGHPAALPTAQAAHQHARKGVSDYEAAVLNEVIADIDF